MPELRTIRLTYESHASLLLDFLVRNADFFRNFENEEPSEETARGILCDTPEGVPKPQKHVLGFFDESALVGFSELVADRHRPGDWLLSLLMVDQTKRSAGLGRQIAAETLEYMQKRGAKAVIGGVVNDNAIALAFWKRLGAIKHDTYYQSKNGKKIKTTSYYREL